MLALVISANAQRSIIGLGAGGGYDHTLVNPNTGMPYGYISPPAGVTALSGQMRSVKNGLLYLDAVRWIEGHNEVVLVVVTNYPGVETLTSGQSIRTNVRRAGVFKDADADNVELYEYFNLDAYRDKIEAQAETEARNKAEAKRAVEQARAEQGKARALQLNQEAAAKGDAYGLLRMGERYRDGDGVDKDLGNARVYFQKAADAGSITAKDEISKLQAQ